MDIFQSIMCVFEISHVKKLYIVEILVSPHEIPMYDKWTSLNFRTTITLHKSGYISILKNIITFN